MLRSQHHHHCQRIGYILMASRNKRLKRVYFDPKRVSSYGGVDALRRVTRVPRKIVEEWLSEQDADTVHKPARRHFRRRRVVVGGPRQQWQADLVDLSNLKTDNDGMTFLLTVIDDFTNVAWCVPLKNKSVVDRSRTRISESVRSGSVEEVRHPPLLHSQRGNESEHRRKIQ